ncbi:ribokinase [Pseudogemmobacter sonorensis]|uniref:ribokinase n=1 Tax=Pseudogemmobacter sonorensis TaxID=2989681 RepID=UPI0036A9149F
MKPVVILGIFVADTGFRAARLPRPGETLLAEGFTLGPGGKGSNQAVAAASAARGTGRGVHFITRLGRDPFADLAHATWAEAGVTPETFADPQDRTGAAFIFVDAATGENAIIVAPGAAARIGTAEPEAKADLIRGAAVFVTQLEQPLCAARRGLEIARAAGVTTILNPAPACALDEGLLRLCDFVTPNETEAEALTGLAVTSVESAGRAAGALIARGAGAAVVTLGAQGALYRDGTRMIHQPAFDAGRVVETTGAGDAFNGAFALALAEGQDPAQALRFATATAAIAVTRAGAAAAMPARGETLALLERLG